MCSDNSPFHQVNSLSLIYSEAMLKKLHNLAGISKDAADKKVQIALIKDGDEIKRYYFTHQALVDNKMTDKEAAFVTLGESFKKEEPVWLYDKFKMIKVNPADVVYSGNEDEIPEELKAIQDLPIIEGNYYNYCNRNSLNPRTPELSAA